MPDLVLRARARISYPFLADIINRKQIDAETREALSIIDDLCLVDLLPKVQDYTSFVQQTVEQTKKSAAEASGDFVYENKPPISPVMMLGLAKGVAKNLFDGMCRNSFSEVDLIW